jgi:signal transduction histidine kinase
MRRYLRGKPGSLAAFLIIAALVAGGLGWVTAATLRLEQAQRQARREAELYDQRLEQERLTAAALEDHENKLRLALWRLDSLIAPVLAKEDSRPYNHYSAVYVPPQMLRTNGSAWSRGTVLEPSPLLSAELPDWMLLHFQADQESGWRSPQVLSARLTALLRKGPVPMTNVTAPRAQLLADLAQQQPARNLLAVVQERGTRPPLVDSTLVPANNSVLANNSVSQGPQLAAQGQALDSEYGNRSRRQYETQQQANPKGINEDLSVVARNSSRNGVDWFSPTDGKVSRGEEVSVALGPMVPLWLDSKDQPEQLVLARHVHLGKKAICQGIVLDWPRLQTLLLGEVRNDLFPQARLQPVREEIPPHSERTMTTLPVELDPGAGPILARDPALLHTAAVEESSTGWTPLRVGLALAWAAALVALAAVGLGGWSLLDLSERRIRFVSAVTHELRTPLTTLRLYLDMLAGGLVREPAQQEEYIQTLNVEADRLNRLVSNVLDFSRLENQRPRLARSPVALGELLAQVASTWQARCQSTGKELVVDNLLTDDVRLVTDGQVVQQILGNLIDNACKYSRGATDPRIWLRASGAGRQQLLLEVEDRGPGVPRPEREAIFRPFRRGRTVDTTAGGVGLGLALVHRWTQLLGGKLSLRPARDASGACFGVELPMS